jgi:hypothetical protein
VLICRPVSRRSAPAKIQSWIEEMKELRLQYSHDPDACFFIDRCIEHAAEWLSPSRG